MYCAYLLDMTTLFRNGSESLILYDTLLKPINQYYMEIFQQLYRVDQLYDTDLYRYIVRL